ncbi:MAG: hypothetical protein MJZ21_02870, partial [archaeon]|nr:hypothetical protein [archaeon]
ISMTATGKKSDGAVKMRELSTVIDGQLGTAQKTEAFYVTYSSSTFKVGNTGSLANSMIIAAGGNSITVGGGNGSTYAANITDLVEKHPNVVIFIDNTIASNEAVLANFNELIKGSNVKVVALNPLWNNYSLESVEGVKAMATAMYPEIFAQGTEVPGESTIVVNGTDKVIITDDVIGDKDAVAVVLTDVTIRLPAAALDKMDSSAVSIAATASSVTDDTIADKIGKKVMTDKVTKISIDVTNAATTSDLGTVTVTVPYEKTESDSVVAVYFIGATGVEKLNTTFTDGKVAFETTHFSDFAIVELEKDPTVEPKTTYAMLAIVGVLAVIGIGALVVSSKKH